MCACRVCLGVRDRGVPLRATSPRTGCIRTERQEAQAATAAAVRHELRDTAGTTHRHHTDTGAGNSKAGGADDDDRAGLRPDGASSAEVGVRRGCAAAGAFRSAELRHKCEALEAQCQVP